jgi:chorismate dehydratase
LPLRIGCVKYLNARPLIRGWLGRVDFDHPSNLCRKLARGDLDVALVSSLEYLRQPIYRIVDGVSISACGPVYSVVLAHERPLDAISVIERDTASQTSLVLLELLLRKRKIAPQIVRAGAPVANATPAKLLIGDQAIQFRTKQGAKFEYWDLAQAWHEMTGLPFVFALWLVRPEVNSPNEIADRLRRIRDENLRKIDDLIAAETDVSAAFCRKYYCEHLCFDFGQKEKDGLREFHRLCRANAILVASELPLHLV